MRASKLLLAVAILAVPTFLACSDEDPSNVSLEGLTADEAQEFFSAMQSAFQYSPSSPSVGGPSGIAPYYAPETQINVDTTQNTQPCPLSGSVLSVVQDSMMIVSDARLNPTPDTAYAVDATFGGVVQVNTTYANCQAQDSRGRTWTIDADPGLAWDINIDGEIHLAAPSGAPPVNNTTFQWDGQWQGSLNWEHDGRSGTCAVSMTMTGSSSFSGGAGSTSITQTGQVCGVSVNATS